MASAQTFKLSHEEGAPQINFPLLALKKYGTPPQFNRPYGDENKKKTLSDHNIMD